MEKQLDLLLEWLEDVIKSNMEIRKNYISISISNYMEETPLSFSYGYCLGSVNFYNQRILLMYELKQKVQDNKDNSPSLEKLVIWTEEQVKKEKGIINIYCNDKMTDSTALYMAHLGRLVTCQNFLVKLKSILKGESPFEEQD